MDKPADRNFDTIADHFEQKIYGKRKGKIRLAVLWRDIHTHLTQNSKQKKLKVLDIGGGFGQISQKLARLGHDVTVTDISENMLKKAKSFALAEGITNIKFVHAPYQALTQLLTEKYDLILCHAVLEWLAEPEQALSVCHHLLAHDGTLSLCFYNPVAKIYRNLLMGNFYLLDNIATKNFSSDQGSLTPNNPCQIEEVQNWLINLGFSTLSETGVRVFSDYVTQKRGGNEHLDAVIEKELIYSLQTPYKYIGRYFHVLAKKTN